MTGCPPWDSPCAGRTLTQLPAVTSVNAAGVTSLTFVDGVKSTVALPFCWVTCAALPDTDVIRPLTRVWPVAGGVADVEGVAPEPLAAGAEDWGLAVFDEPHAATDSAVAALTATSANRARRDV